MANSSRRTFLRSAGFTAGGLASNRMGAQISAGDAELRSLVSQSDLIYTRPVERSEEGIPVGNGRMGSLVWTTPGQLHFQINRVDVYASSCTSNSFVEPHNDYCGGCAFLDIDFGGKAFPESGFRQHLSLWDGVLTIEGDHVVVRVAPSTAHDVFVIGVEDRRDARGPLSIVLRMLRYQAGYAGPQTEVLANQHAAMVRRRSHTATSSLVAEDGRIALVQDFREGAWCSKSAVAVTACGGAGEAEILNETTIRLSVQRSGATTILVSSAAAFHRDEDVAAAAFRHLDIACEKGISTLGKESREWWRRFWALGSVELHSRDGAAELVQQNYHYFLYLMAATSRGMFPPKFNGMLWNTGGDLRSWGAQHWFANLSCYYEPLPASGRFELMDPMYAMYSAMFDSCARAARQQWGSEGLYIPETVCFDGLEELPEAIAAEMRELYLLRKPWDQRSGEFREFAEKKHPYSSRWNWVASRTWKDGALLLTERGSGPYGPTSHMFCTTAKVAWLYWRRYEYTLDREWLRDRAWPMLRGAVEFYRNYPNMRKGDEGKYHIHWVNSGEPVFGARDAIEDISSIQATTAALLRASEILGADADMRPVWREFLDQLAPLPTSDHPDALRPPDYNGPRIFVSALKPAIKADRKPDGWLPDLNSMPTWFFDLCNMESANRETLALAQSTLDRMLRGGLQPDGAAGSLSKLPMAAASLGRADAVQVLIPAQIRSAPVPRSPWYGKGAPLKNRLTLREAAQALNAQHLGRAAEALHLALLQSTPPAPGAEPILRLFPAWPRQWDARYTLHARGAFTVTASIQRGLIGPVELTSHAGAICRLRNPWPSDVVELWRDQHRQPQRLQGSLLEFATSKGERLVVKALTEQ